MTQEQKDLLLKDLCARMPYGVKVDIINEDNEHHIVKIGEGNIGHLGKGFWKDCKPYLFPISSMTEEQDKEFMNIQIGYPSVDWFNKNHIDYRGLIPMGLAKDATGLNVY